MGGSADSVSPITMTVPFNKFQLQADPVNQQILAAVGGVMDAGMFILGEQVERFEWDWARACNVSHAIGVGNCFDATLLGLQALGIGPGDEVITTPETAFATSLAVLRVGATPVLADIELSTGHMSLESAAQCLTDRTKAVLFVHLYGQAGNVDAWLDFCFSNRIDFIEDCAQAHGAKSAGVPVGSLGVYGAWSFYPTKNLGCLGDGGALTTNDAKLAQQVSMLRNYGQSKRYHHDVLGINSRLDELQAAILSVRLTVLDEWNERRRKVAATYHASLSSAAIEKMDAPVSPDSHVHHLYVVRSRQRAALMEYLAARGIETLIHYPVLVNHQKAAAKRVTIGPGGLRQAEYHASTCLSLPCHPYMTEEQVMYVVDTINSFE